MGYKMSPLDYCMYIWKNGNKVTLLSLYIDNILIVRSTQDMMNKKKEFLKCRFV